MTIPPFRTTLWMLAGVLCIPPGVAFGQTPPPAEAGLSLMQALQTTVRTNPDNLLQQQQVAISEGTLLQARGPFDWVYSANVSRQRDVRPLREDERQENQIFGRDDVTHQAVTATNWTTGLDKKLQNGISVGGSISSTRVEDSAQTISGIAAQTTNKVTFTLKVPVLKGLGRTATAGDLRASEEDYQADRAELVQTTARSALNTALAYWDYLARQRRLEIAKAAETRGQALVEEMRRLIKADQMPPAEIDILLASRAEKTVARVQAEQAYSEARRTLARSMGLPAAQTMSLPPAADAFPEYGGGSNGRYAASSALQNSALQGRPDLLALRKRGAAARHRMLAARENLKAQVDLSMSGGYAHLDEGADAFGSDAFRYPAGRRGPFFALALSAQFPQRNSAAKGVFLAQSSLHEASNIRARELEANIASAVQVQLEALQRAAQQLSEGGEAVQRYTVSLRNEQTKRRLGQATLIDVITLQDRLDGALALQVQLQQGYAAAIAQLRFELGTLVRANRDSFDLRVEDFVNDSFQIPPAPRTEPRP